MYEVSGSFISLSGVGTQMAIASHSPAREKSVVASIRPLPTQLRELLGGNVGDVAAARVDLGGLLVGDVDADDVVARLGHLDGERQSDVAEADDAEDGTAVTKTLFESHALRAPYRVEVVAASPILSAHAPQRAEDRRHFIANISSPEQASSPSTVALASPNPIGPRVLVIVHSSRSVSPGTTCRLKRTLSMPAKNASLPWFSGSESSATAPHLRKRLDDEHAGHDRVVGEVPRHPERVSAHVELADRRDTRLELEHAVDAAGTGRGAG